MGQFRSRKPRRPDLLSRKAPPRSGSRGPARHKDIHFHFAPTDAMWLNPVAIPFLILRSQSRRVARFTGPGQLRSSMDAFVVAWSNIDQRFTWKQQVVFREHPNALRA